MARSLRVQGSAQSHTTWLPCCPAPLRRKVMGPAWLLRAGAIWEGLRPAVPLLSPFTGWPFVCEEPYVETKCYYQLKSCVAAGFYLGANYLPHGLFFFFFFFPLLFFKQVLFPV